MKINQKTKNLIAKAVESDLKNNLENIYRIAYYGFTGIYHMTDEDLIKIADKYNITIEYD